MAGRFDALTQLNNNPPPPAPPVAAGVSGKPSPTPPLQPTHEQPVKEQRPVPPLPNTRTGERPNARTMQRSNGRRIITRNSFEIYEDQMDSLRKLSARELETTGKLGSMSAMVREAIDSYIQKKSSVK